MKKLIVLIALVGSAALAAIAQNPVVNNPDNKTYFGLRLGGEVICPGQISTGNVGLNVFKKGGGVELGGIVNLPVVANFYVEPGLKFYYNTDSYKQEFLDLISAGAGLTGASIRKFGMRIPVMAGYHFDFTDEVKVSVFTGPELEIGFSAKEYIKGNNIIDMTENLYGEDGGMKRVNVLWGVGAGITYRHFYFGVNGSIGMLNMFTESNVTFRENRVTFSVGYNF